MPSIVKARKRAVFGWQAGFDCFASKNYVIGSSSKE